MLLSIETSTHSFSCALHSNGKLISFEESIGPQTTASMLAVTVDKLFKDSSSKKNNLEGVVVASGPGSYTGLRIGVATAKGICYALNIPLISISTLYLMAYQQRKMAIDGALLCPMLDARRMEVYCALYDVDLKIVEPIQAKVVDENSFVNELVNRQVIFFGEGAAKCKSVITSSRATFLDDIRPTASALGEVGLQKFRESAFEDLEHFEPFYLKDFVIKKPNSVA